MALVFGGAFAADAADAVQGFMERIGVCTSLGQLGVLPSQIDCLAENGIKVSTSSMQNHPVVFSAVEIHQLYTACL